MREATNLEIWLWPFAKKLHPSTSSSLCHMLQHSHVVESGVATISQKGLSHIHNECYDDLKSGS